MKRDTFQNVYLLAIWNLHVMAEVADGGFHTKHFVTQVQYLFKQPVLKKDKSYLPLLVLV
jgi:hypothetical protein